MAVLEEAVRDKPKDTIYYCCRYAISVLEKNTGINASGDGTFIGREYFTLGDFRRWKQWVVEYNNGIDFLQNVNPVTWVHAKTNGETETLTLYTSGFFEFQKTIHLLKEVTVGRWYRRGRSAVDFVPDTAFKMTNVLVIPVRSRPGEKGRLLIHSIASKDGVVGRLIISDGVSSIERPMDTAVIEVPLSRVETIKLFFNGREYEYKNEDPDLKSFEIFVNFDGYSVRDDLYFRRGTKRNAAFQIRGNIFAKVDIQ